MKQVLYIPRSIWGGGPLRSGHVVPHSQFKRLVFHHVVTEVLDYDYDSMVNGDIDDICEYMRRLQHARPDLGDEVPYSHVGFEGAHEDDVIVAEGRGFGVTGAHTIGYNSSAYGFAFAGNYTNKRPTRGQWDGGIWIGSQLHDPTNAGPSLEHRDVYATQCPGLMTETPALAQPPFTFTIQPENEVPMPVVMQYVDDLDAFYVDENGALKQHFYTDQPAPPHWGTFVLATGLKPNAEVAVQRDWRGDVGRLDFFVEAEPTGLAHVWWRPGNATWVKEVL